MTEEISAKKNKHASVRFSHLTSSKSITRFNFKEFQIRRLTKRNKTRIDKNKENKEEMEEELKKMKKILRHASAYDLCINALSYTPSERTIELNKTISFYLKNLKNFMNILSDADKEEIEKILYDIASHLNYEKYEKNNVICKYGDTAEKFYIILKGKVIFLVPKIKKHYLSEEEYLEYLFNLRKKEE